MAEMGCESFQRYAPASPHRVLSLQTAALVASSLHHSCSASFSKVLKLPIVPVYYTTLRRDISIHCGDRMACPFEGSCAPSLSKWMKTNPFQPFMAVPTCSTVAFSPLRTPFTISTRSPLFIMLLLSCGALLRTNPYGVHHHLSMWQATARWQPGARCAVS